MMRVPERGLSARVHSARKSWGLVAEVVMRVARGERAL